MSAGALSCGTEVDGESSLIETRNALRSVPDRLADGVGGENRPVPGLETDPGPGGSPDDAELPVVHGTAAIPATESRDQAVASPGSSAVSACRSPDGKDLCWRVVCGVRSGTGGVERRYIVCHRPLPVGERAVLPAGTTVWTGRIARKQ